MPGNGEARAQDRGRAGPKSSLAACGGIALSLLAANVAIAEEIQGTDPASPGHWQVEQRFGYLTTFEAAPAGTPASLASQHAITGETEFSYSPTDWYEIALTTPYALARDSTQRSDFGALQNYAVQSGGFTFKQTFIQSDREEQTVFFGLVARAMVMPAGTMNADFFVRNTNRIGGAHAPQFIQDSNARFGAMFTPIVGVHLPADFEMIFNANASFAVGGQGSALEPSLRIVKRLSDTLDVGIEHFANLGPIGYVLPLNQQTQTLYAVADTKFRGFEFSFGVGYGLTAASKGPALKMTIGKDF